MPEVNPDRASFADKARRLAERLGPILKQDSEVYAPENLTVVEPAPPTILDEASLREAAYREAFIEGNPSLELLYGAGRIVESLGGQHWAILPTKRQTWKY
jgi:hypothetical protein